MMRTASAGVEFFPASDSSLLVRFPGKDLLLANQQVLALAARLQQNAVARNLHPAYDTLLIAFDPLAHSHAQVEELVRSELRAEPQAASRRTIEVPVCYGGDFGPDLEDLARHAGLTSHAVIDLHSKPVYRVYFLGFAPGFPYLGGMDPRIAIPRLSSPRKEVPPGSVAIADENTGIYPVASPGGWRIIGRTPLRLFTPNADDPTLLQPGDSVRFRAITREEFAEAQR
jgi:KipI family sensor histidine kinase inhibitor